MNYLRVPKQVSSHDILKNGVSWSPSMYSKVIIPNGNVKRVEELLDPQNPFDKGVEPGSQWYMDRSPRYFIRTKALQSHSNLIYPKGDAIVPINPKVFVDFNLSDGDILMAKDSNIGECVIVDGDGWKDYMFSSGIVRLNPTNPTIDRYYLFAFLKHPLFKLQLFAMVPSGVTVTHAKTLWKECLIPFPNQSDAEKVVKYVSSLMKAIIDKEREIRKKNNIIDSIIEAEVLENQTSGRHFMYSYPSIHELKLLNRWDASVYSPDYRYRVFLLENYRNGTLDYESFGFEVSRGQNLQVSSIGQSIYSDEPRPNFYRLVAPTDISEYRTVAKFRYLGNKKSLSVLRTGDVVFGAEGFEKGRTIILVDTDQRTITNIHGIIFHPKDGDLNKGIFFGCYLGYLRKLGVIDAISAGASGGSLGIGYLHHVPIPKFPPERQAQIARLYHNPAPQPAWTPTLDTFVDWHREWNVDLGIWELDHEMKALQKTLADVQEQIIEGVPVNVPF